MAKNFEKLRKQVRSDPERAENVELYKRAMLDAIALAELREQLDATQEDLAAFMGTTQENISRIERAHNIYLSTLAGYVGALGGHLEINAVFEDRVIPLAGVEEKEEAKA